MSSKQVHEAQETLSGLSLQEVIEIEEEAKEGCVTRDGDGGEFFSTDATSYHMYLAATNEKAWHLEVSESRGNVP